MLNKSVNGDIAHIMSFLSHHPQNSILHYISRNGKYIFREYFSSHPVPLVTIMPYVCTCSFSLGKGLSYHYLFLTLQQPPNSLEQELSGPFRRLRWRKPLPCTPDCHPKGLYLPNQAAGPWYVVPVLPVLKSALTVWHPNTVRMGAKRT